MAKPGPKTAKAKATVKHNTVQHGIRSNIAAIDGIAGLSAAKRRVLGLALVYSTGERAVYRQRITLGAV